MYQQESDGISSFSSQSNPRSQSSDRTTQVEDIFQIDVINLLHERQIINDEIASLQKNDRKRAFEIQNQVVQNVKKHLQQSMTQIEERDSQIVNEVINRLFAVNTTKGVIEVEFDIVPHKTQNNKYNQVMEIFQDVGNDQNFKIYSNILQRKINEEDTNFIYFGEIKRDFFNWDLQHTYFNKYYFCQHLQVKMCYRSKSTRMTKEFAYTYNESELAVTFDNQNVSFFVKTQSQVKVSFFKRSYTITIICSQNKNLSALNGLAIDEVEELFSSKIIIDSKIQKLQKVILIFKKLQNTNKAFLEKFCENYNAVITLVVFKKLKTQYQEFSKKVNQHINSLRQEIKQQIRQEIKQQNSSLRQEIGEIKQMLNQMMLTAKK